MLGRNRMRKPASSSASQPIASSSRSRQRFASQAISSHSDESLHTQEVTDEQEIVEASNSVVIMALHYSCSGKPFKKSELLQGSHIKNRRTVETVIASAKLKLQTVYGLELVEIASSKYILVLPKDTPFRDELAVTNPVGFSASREFTCLLGIILSLIVLQKGRLSLEYLRKTMLPKLFPDIEVNPHPFFGNVDKLFQKFEQQVYVEREVETRGGETAVFLKWGRRAELEFDTKNVTLPVLSEMFGGNVPNFLLNDLPETEAESRN